MRHFSVPTTTMHCILASIKIGAVSVVFPLPSHVLLLDQINYNVWAMFFSRLYIISLPYVNYILNSTVCSVIWFRIRSAFILTTYPFLATYSFSIVYSTHQSHCMLLRIYSPFYVSLHCIALGQNFALLLGLALAFVLFYFVHDITCYCCYYAIPIYTTIVSMNIVVIFFYMQWSELGCSTCHVLCYFLLLFVSLRMHFPSNLCYVTRPLVTAQSRFHLLVGVVAMDSALPFCSLSDVCFFFLLLPVLHHTPSLVWSFAFAFESCITTLISHHSFAICFFLGNCNMTRCWDDT